VPNKHKRLFIDMKDLLQKWKRYLIQEGVEHYNISGQMRLYHYSEAQDDSITLDPEYFLSNRKSFTRNDFQASDLARVFFYTNLDHAENIVKQGRTLYSVFVDTSKIYDMTKDPASLKKDARNWPTNIRGEKIKDGHAPLNTDLLIRSIAGKPSGGMELVPLPDDQKYSGAFYKTGDMDVVVWFEPIEVHKFNPEDVNSPANNEEEG